MKVAYGAGKFAVKGTAAAVRAVVPDDEDAKPEKEPQDRKDAQEPEPKPAR